MDQQPSHQGRAGLPAAAPAVERGVFLAVAGNLGVGKTTLVGMLARAFGMQPHYEWVEENPYLARFYADMRAWAFHSQLFFLVKRAEQHRGLVSSPTAAVQDRTIYEDAEIWARNLYERGQIADEDFHLYAHLYEELCRGLPPPDLIVYLSASARTLQQRIALRGRDFEAQIEPAYVERLNERYEAWATRCERCPLIRLETDELDLVRSPQDRVDVLELLRARLSALRPEQAWPPLVLPEE
jgi:deoxyadenosine/deoxycytidine kinase